MKLKCIVLLTLLLQIQTAAAQQLPVTTDPFIKTWTNYDGVNTTTLTISDSKVQPNQGYYYMHSTAPQGGFTFDLCTATSSTVIQCYPGQLGATLTRNDANYSITLSALGDVSVYYDPAHLPPLPPVVGSWKQVSGKMNYFLQITRGNSDAEFNVSSSYLSTDGSVPPCNQTTQPEPFQMTMQADGTQLFFRVMYPDLPSTWHYFLYDPVSNQITSAGPEDNLMAGDCYSYISDIGVNKPYFNKI